MANTSFENLKARQSAIAPESVKKLSAFDALKQRQSLIGEQPTQSQPKEEQDGFFKSLVKAPATILARPFQLGAELLIPGDNTEAIDKFSKEKLGGFVAPVPRNTADVKKDVGRGVQTVALGLPGIASGGAAFGLGASIEQGNDLLSTDTALSTAGGALAGKLLGFVGKPIIDAAGKVIGKITPQIVKDVASKGAGAVDEFMAKNQLLPKGASDIINTGANKLENVVNKPFELAKDVTKAILPKPENIMNRVARLNPSDAAKFKQMTGESHGDYLVRTGNFSTPEEIVNKEFAKFQASKNEADTAFAQIKGKFRTPEIKNAIDDLVSRETNIGVEGGDSSVIRELAKKYETQGLDMTEINQVKRLVEKQKLSYFRENAPDKIERATRIDSALRNWQFKEAGVRGFKNISAINKQTQASRFIVDKLGNQLTGKSGNELIPLSDLIILSGGNIQNIVGYLAKRGFGSKTFQSKLAKILNSKEVAPFIKAQVGESEILSLPAPKVFEMGGAKSPTTFEAPAKQIRRTSVPQLQLPAPKSNAQGIPIQLPQSVRETNLGLDEVKNMFNQRGLNQPISPQIKTKAKIVNIEPKVSQKGAKVKPSLSLGKVEKELEPLAKEARKPIKAIYHGTDKIFKEFDVTKTPDGSIWFTDTKNSITKGTSGASGTKTIIKRFIDENKLKLAGWEEYEKYSLQQLQEKGFDGIKLPDNGKVDYQIFYPEKLSKVINKK
jgi:hypothetical protein